MKQTYVPTEADRLTGENVRQLRRLTGETLVEVIEGSGIGIGQSSLSRVELGQRQLTMPEATKLAAYWNTTPDAIFRKPKRPALEPVVRTEQEFLGNAPGALTFKGDHAEEDLFSSIIPIRQGRTVMIDRDAPMTPEQYRADVWIPYLETRYATEQKTA